MAQLDIDRRKKKTETNETITKRLKKDCVFWGRLFCFVVFFFVFCTFVPSSLESIACIARGMLEVDILPNATLTILPWNGRSAPARTDGVQIHQSDYLSISFNFTGPNQMDSGMNLLLLLFVMVLMVSFSMVLQRTTSKMILHPIEKLLTQVKDTAASIFESVPDLGGEGEAEEDSDEEDNEDGTWKDANFKAVGWRESVSADVCTCCCFGGGTSLVDSEKT